MADVDHDDAAWTQAIAAEAEELARGQVERDVRLAVGVDEDRVVARCRAPQERPRVLAEDAQSRRAHVEEAAADVRALRVELDRVDRRAREVVAIGPGGS